MHHQVQFQTTQCLHPLDIVVFNSGVKVDGFSMELGLSWFIIPLYATRIGSCTIFRASQQPLPQKGGGFGYSESETKK